MADNLYRGIQYAVGRRITTRDPRFNDLRPGEINSEAIRVCRWLNFTIDRHTRTPLTLMKVRRMLERIHNFAKRTGNDQLAFETQWFIDEITRRVPEGPDSQESE